MRSASTRSRGSERTSRKIELKVEGDAACLRESLAAEPGVASVAGVDGAVEVTLKAGERDIGFLARRAVELGLNILSLREESPGLEEIFMQLTKEKKEL